LQRWKAVLQPYSLVCGGVIGIQGDGLLAVRDAKACRFRIEITSTSCCSGKYRPASLYLAIANANGHPEWAAQIKTTLRALDK